MANSESLVETELIPRDYQTKLMQIALHQNSIIYLPTGSGKTFIALMVLRQMGKVLERSVDEGGKVSFLVVNTIPLVDQQANFIKRNTHFKVGSYSSDLLVDSWSQMMWRKEINTHQVLIMTAQILLNIIETSFISLNEINLIIFDECHHGVHDHCMRQIMMHFRDVCDPPRILGLSAALINKNIKESQVEVTIKTLETSFHSKIATVEELQSVLGFRSNPTEIVRLFVSNEPSAVDTMAINLLEDLIHDLSLIKIDTSFCTPATLNLQIMVPAKGLKNIINLIKDSMYHINTLGTFGGQLSILAHMIQLERLKKAAQTKQMSMVLDSILTTFTIIHKLFGDNMQPFSEKDKIYKFSADQVLLLFDTMRDYRKRAKEDICGIIFVQRRQTAKVIYYILKQLQKCDHEFSYLKPNFIVGFNNNPNNDTREGLYITKMNKKVISQFQTKEINIIVSSSVLEEGVDIPTCTFINKFDKPMDYRSYVQSKGRARHKNSLYYILVDKLEASSFTSAYNTYQQIENQLNDLVVGQNEYRLGPSSNEIQALYDEQVLPPYYVGGPGTAQVNLLSAISLLCRYCLSLPSDRYTVYNPIWYIDKLADASNEEKFLYKVIIELPIICPLTDPIEGPYVSTKKLAKRAAALKACELLHKARELDDTLMPKQHTVLEENTSVFFTHWPTQTRNAKTNFKNLRTYRKQIPQVLNSQIECNESLYLHVIEITPLFDDEAPAIKMMHELYTSQLCFGMLSRNPLPKLCDFPLYVTAGELKITIKNNIACPALNSQQLSDIKGFHCLVFRDLLKVLKSFLLIDNGSNVEGILIAPINKNNFEIDFDVIYNNKQLIDPKIEPVDQEKLNLQVSEESYIGKIVTPWYRLDDTTYLVISVCHNLSANSDFPSEEFNCYTDYFYDKYHARVLKPQQPLILVKPLSKRLNCLKPRGCGKKRSKDRSYKEMEAHLVPELCIKQNFPSCLWIVAKLLPSILHRFITLLQAEELYSTISREAGLGKCTSYNWKPLALDPYLIHYDYEELKKSKTKTKIDEPQGFVELPKSELLMLVQDVNAKKLEKEYPWSTKDEPVDIERNLDVTLMDIQYFHNFMDQKVTIEERLSKNTENHQNEYLAITYNKHFVEKSIQLLQPKLWYEGPELVDVYKAIITAKGNDVINLERSETLGDSFLKLSVSLFIMLRFPQYEEGRATALKGQLISNKNLYYIALNKQLCGYIKNSEFTPTFEWKPPYFCLPDILEDKLNRNNIPASSIFAFLLSNEEQGAGVLSLENEQQILNCFEEPEKDKNENGHESLLQFLDLLKLSDKTVADCVEGLLGVYFESCGFLGALKLICWLGIIPANENIENLLNQTIPNPILNSRATMEDVDYFLPSWKEIELRLGYHFNNRAFLLQALTHSSFVANRITSCYQKLEFLGDAILDFLITCHIYETCPSLTPGDLTDLRSALVNNITFAGFSVRCGFHKFLLYTNLHLQSLMENFVVFQESHDYKINNDVLFLFGENDLHLAEHVDVPKVLGDIFEALAGAVFLDSGMDLNTVWKVFYKIMWKEIDMFKNDIPKNFIRMLHETIGAHPHFMPPVSIQSGATMVALDFMLEGIKKRVYGFGDNKAAAKRAAAKIALRLLKK